MPVIEQQKMVTKLALQFKLLISPQFSIVVNTSPWNSLLKSLVKVNQ